MSTAIPKFRSFTTAMKHVFWGRKSSSPGEGQKFCALYVGGALRPVARPLGDNRGPYRPLRIGYTDCWDDALNAKFEWAHPTRGEWGTISRIWCSGRSKVKTLHNFLLEDFERHLVEFEKLDKDAWVAFGPNFDVRALERRVRAVAEKHGIQTWTDIELYQHLKKLDSENQPTAQVRKIRERVEAESRRSSGRKGI